MNENKGKKFLSDLKLYSDYFKWRDDRYENWQEACEDIINGHRLKYTGLDIEKYLSKALAVTTNQEVLASQRNLQYRHKQIMQHNMRMFNCTTTHVMRNRVFQEVFYISLCGSGAGGSLLIPFVNNLSGIKERTDGTQTYVIQDSIEGWADALGVLMSSYFVDYQPFPEYANYKIKFDYSQIREKGAYISGGFRAPGPEGLKKALENIENLIDTWIKKQGDKIRPILAFDILCYAADAVLSGGVRRSALNMIVDPNDEEMIMAKTGNWRQENPQRGRSNNSVLLLRSITTKEQFEKIVRINNGSNDIGFVFANSWFDIFNPCFEISFTPVLYDGDLTKIHYDDLEEFTRVYKDKFGIQGCNLDEINAEKSVNEQKFLEQCEGSAILGTLQAGYDSFPYLGEVTEQLFKREALLGISVTGWMNNPKLFNADLLRKGVEVIRATNKELAKVLGINQAARLTCVKPSGNASVVLGTASGIHPEHSQRYFRIMQLNKETDTAKWIAENMDFLIEDSAYSETKTDYVVFVPIVNPADGMFKKDMKGVKHLKLIKMVQENWVLPGTNKELGISPNINHNVSATVIIDNMDEIIDYIWDNKQDFTAVSFLSDYGDKDFNQAPFTSVLTLQEIVDSYGKGSLLASGLVVDGLHYFHNNLWDACQAVGNKDFELSGTREQVLLKEYWVKRAKKFAKNYFKGDVNKMIYCLKDVHLFHKWETVSRQFKDVDFNKILTRPTYKDVNEFSAMSCSGGSCEIKRI